MTSRRNKFMRELDTEMPVLLKLSRYPSMSWVDVSPNSL